jgi:hypothetical protein
MLRSLKELQGYTVRATDGDVGSLGDFYFDDQSWTIRYLVIDTGNWLKGRRVLIPPAVGGAPKAVIHEIEWGSEGFTVQRKREAFLLYACRSETIGGLHGGWDGLEY